MILMVGHFQGVFMAGKKWHKKLKQARKSTDVSLELQAHVIELSIELLCGCAIFYVTRLR